jgi:hypothetical protein
VVRSGGWGLLRLWLPTVFGASMLVVEIPLVSAAAARSTAGGAALAAIGIGMSILVVVNTPALAIAALVAGERDRHHPRRLRHHTLLVGAAGTLVLLLLAAPPGAAAVSAVFGLEAEVRTAVAAFLLGLAPNSLGVAIRRHQHGRLIHERHTRPIVWATLVRLAVTAAVAWAGVALFPGHGPLVAGLALTLGAFLEAAALAAARSEARGPAGPLDGSWIGLTVRHGHLSAARLLVMVPTVVTTIGVAHAAQAPASLVVWPVLIQLAALFTSPTTDWEAVAATALHDGPGSRTPAQVTAWLAATIAALFTVVVLAGPAELFVRGLLAVPDDAAGLGLSWLWLLLPLPALWVTRAYLRGVVMAAGGHRWLSYAGAGHAVVLVGLLAVLVRTDLPGVACAGISLVGGVAGETLLTWYATRAALRLSPTAP